MKERPKREGIMLAYPAEEGRISRLGKFCLAQPKLNGERCKVEWFAEEPVLISSYGNEFKFMNHITEALKGLHRHFGPIPLDGEIYVHGWSREQIDSALRRRVNISSEVAHLEYHVFDICSSDPANERSAVLLGMSKLGYINSKDSPVKLVPALLTETKDWLNYATNFVESGYEGVILRNLDAKWEAKRTVNMLKFKPTEKDEYVILAVNEAIDKHGIPKSMVGSFTVKSDNVNESFDVGAGKLNHKKRKDLWDIRQYLVGKKLIVKHELIKTSGGVPLCAVAVDVL